MHVGIMVLIIDSGIVTSRKRKLREFFAVCDNENPIPQIDLKNIDAPPSTPAERHFLEVSDILQYAMRAIRIFFRAIPSTVASARVKLLILAF